MSEFVQHFETPDGNKKYDFNALGNFPAAEVGALLRVAAVDENGNPTAWEIVKLNAADVGAAAANHGVHVSYSTAAPAAAGTASAGSAATVSRSDHIHPAQTDVSGNAGTATKLKTARAIQTNLASTSAAPFDGGANVTPGVTGILPVANGGTGVDNLSALAAALGASKFVLGTYVGDGAESRTISLGFTPKALLVMTDDGATTISTASIAYYGGLAIQGHPVKLSGDYAVVEIVDYGFKVAIKSFTQSYISSNSINRKYHYIAFA